MIVSFTLRLSLTCSGCKMAVPVNGITPSLACYHCGEVLKLGPSFWTDAVEPDKLAEASAMGEGEGRVVSTLGGSSYELAYGKRTPRCQSCKGPDLDVTTLGQFAANGRCFCPACGHGIRVRVADDLVRAIAPTARLVVGESTLSADEQKLQQKRTPILFACMGCGGGLQVDGSIRAVVCQYCQASNYLPDGLWQQLNPVPKVSVFFLLCEYDESSLRKLRWSDDEARELDAKSATIPPADLAELSRDKEDDVRKAVAGNPRTPAEILAILARDSEDDVAEAVARNPATPPAIAWELASHHEYDVVCALLENPLMPGPIVEQCAKHERYEPRVAAATHPNLSLDTLHRLAHDSDSDVERAAKGRLEALRAQGVDVNAGRGFFKKILD